MLADCFVVDGTRPVTLMSDEEKKRKRKGPTKKVEPVFITKTEIAHHIGLADATTLDKWIADREFPPPHSRPGGRFVVWLRSHWDHYVATGDWPREAWRRPYGETEDR